MRIHNISLTNIGPFKNAFLDFTGTNDEQVSPPVIIITGENGTGKSVIIDALRSLLIGVYGPIERDVFPKENFEIKAELEIDKAKHSLHSNSRHSPKVLSTNNHDLNSVFRSDTKSAFKRSFIFDYWTSRLSNDSFDIDSIAHIKPENYLDLSLAGIHKNIELTKSISFFDYLKDSKDPGEKELGTELYKILEEVINISINDGSLSHVSRINLMPIIKIGNKELPLDKLSSGNLYLIQRLINLVRQVYSICVLNKLFIADYKKIPGVILIDEAENHLHPKWQKVLLKSILKIFPNLQLIVTTHSPFIVSSVDYCRIYVCSSRTDHSIVSEQTGEFSNKPVEEILMSPLFNTNNFSSEISELIKKRKEAITNKNYTYAEEIEAVLLKINPEYFNYFNIKDLLKSISKS